MVKRPRLRQPVVTNLRATCVAAAASWPFTGPSTIFSDWNGFTDLLGRSWQDGRSDEEHSAFQIVPSSDARGGWAACRHGQPRMARPSNIASGEARRSRFSQRPAPLQTVGISLSRSCTKWDEEERSSRQFAEASPRAPTLRCKPGSFARLDGLPDSGLTADGNLRWHGYRHAFPVECERLERP